MTSSSSTRYIPSWWGAECGTRSAGFLCEPSNPHTDRYVETRGGASALKQLAWGQVFAHADRVRLARSLFEDIAMALGVEHPFPGENHPATASFKTARTLRNL